jgi:ABC-type multidrug transport system fused ATPase/permease subunit
MCVCVGGVLGQGAAMLLANLAQHMSFAYSGEKLIKRLRLLLFQSFLRQEIGWFDDTRRTTGVLSTKLSNDVARIEGISGSRLGMLVQLISTVVAGLIIAFTAEWRLALVILATIPLMAIGGMMQMKVRPPSHRTTSTLADASLTWVGGWVGGCVHLVCGARATSLAWLPSR